MKSQGPIIIKRKNGLGTNIPRRKSQPNLPNYCIYIKRFTSAYNSPINLTLQIWWPSWYHSHLELNISIFARFGSIRPSRMEGINEWNVMWCDAMRWRFLWLQNLVILDDQDMRCKYDSKLLYRWTEYAIHLNSWGI